MKKLISKIKSVNVANIIATFAMVASVIDANSMCICFFHDPEKPDLTQFRKF